MVCPPCATRLNPLAPVSTTLLLTNARVSSTTMLSAIERPSPKLLAVAPSLPGSAFVTESLEELALSAAASVSVSWRPRPAPADGSFAAREHQLEGERAGDRVLAATGTRGRQRAVVVAAVDDRRRAVGGQTQGRRHARGQRETGRVEHHSVAHRGQRGREGERDRHPGSDRGPGRGT